MNLFDCPECGRALFFDNHMCTNGHAVRYDPGADRFESRVHDCANLSTIGCNWSAEAPGALCPACQMTRTRPDDNVGQNMLHWQRAEAAKRWSLVGLYRWGWLTDSDTGPRPIFDILTERGKDGRTQPVMGHANGTIVINASEADPVEITRRREQMEEPYRTMIGHFRHEMAHFLWWRLAQQDGFVDAFRSHFGDESVDYAAALERHYAEGPPDRWEDGYISAYASSHPHEDWAETAAHVLHLSDLMDSAEAVGLTLARQPRSDDTESALTAGLDLGLALNHLNRSMGADDPYPFVVSSPARAKLEFAWETLAAGPA